MTEDHRVTSATERARFAKIGKPLKDGEARLCGNFLIFFRNASVADTFYFVVWNPNLLVQSLLSTIFRNKYLSNAW